MSNGHNHNPFVKKVLALFKKTHEEDDSSKYPPALNAKYKIEDKTLGVGSFAVVKECSERASGEKCAVKIILKKVIAG
jgi:calcium/calmodulin-dependent protein kinase I